MPRKKDQTTQIKGEVLFSKPLPSSNDAERCVLGAVLLDENIIAQAAEALEADDFYSPFHRRIYTAMLSLFNSNRTIDPILIAEELKRDGDAATVGGIAAITNLSYGLPHFTDVGEYLQIIRQKSLLRRLIMSCAQITSDALEEEEDSELVLDRAEQMIFTLSQERDQGAAGPVLAELLAYESLTKAYERRKSGEIVQGIKTGLRDLDSFLAGFKQQDLIILAARPSMGKTAAALQFLVNAALDDHVVFFASLEMSKEQVIDRTIAQIADISLWGYAHNVLSDMQWKQATDVYNTLQGRRFFIDDTPAMTPTQVLAKARKIKTEQKKLDLVAVDYLGLMTSSKPSRERRDDISAISRELKAIAKELKCPVIALSQLSRAPENRNPPRPKLSDLRDSGAIEQDADVVIFLYRPSYYEKKETDSTNYTTEFIIAKNRNGPTDTVEAIWLRDKVKFGNKN